MRSIEEWEADPDQDAALNVALLYGGSFVPNFPLVAREPVRVSLRERLLWTMRHGWPTRAG